MVKPETRHSIRVLEKAETASPVSTLPKQNPLLWIAGLGALVVIIGLGIWAIAGRNPDPSTVNRPTEESPEDNANLLPDTEAEEALEEAPNVALEAPVVVEVSLSDRSWLSVTADGETVFEGTSEAGFEETWTAEDTLVLTAGNAGGVEVSINGNEAVPVGQTGDVRTLTITPEMDADDVEGPS